MKLFLILGHDVDPHAHYVAWALGEAGYRSKFVNSSHDNCPTHITLYIDKETDGFESSDWNDAEAIWCRRLSPRPPSDQGSGQSDDLTLLEDRRFTKWFVQMAETCSCRLVNLPTAAQAAENKFIQLKLARLNGIEIPRTLVTTQPERLRAFLAKEGVVVAKPLEAHTWKNEAGETLSPFATLLDAERGSQLSDEDIAECVTIYQQRIDKVADVRMVVMGADVFAYKAVQNGEQHFDFRIGFFQKGHLNFEEIPVPVALKEKMIRFMESLRINFASADFALRADGKFVFLDLNPSGQWLFLDEFSLDARIGQKFCSFFVTGKVDFETENLFPSFSQYRKSDAAKAINEAFILQSPERTSRCGVGEEKEVK